MKRQNYTRLSISMILFLSCLGVLYITTTSFAENGKQLPLSETPVVLETTLTASLDKKDEIPALPFLQPELNDFADSQTLRFLSNQEALALLVSKANLQPTADNHLRPMQEVSLIEFLKLSLQWLATYSAENNLSPINIATIESTGLKSMVTSGQAITVENLMTWGFADDLQILLQAAACDIPMFSHNPADYSHPVQRWQAVLIINKLAESKLGETVDSSVDLEDYIENAFSLRFHPCTAEIGQAFARGLLSNQEFSVFVPELSFTRSQTADLLSRLFVKEKRVINSKRPREALSDLNLDYYSKAIYLFNNSHKNTVFAFNENIQLPPASLTKLMTVYVAIEHIPDLKAKVSVSSSFRQRMIRSGANIAGFYANESVTYEDLLYATLLSSGAEAAGTLAIRLAGRESVFIDWMNQKAAQLGMQNTVFKTVEGLDANGQYTTAKDIGLLLESALKNPTFYQIVTTPAFVTSPTRSHPKGIKLHSTVLKNIGEHEEHGFRILGGKSGTTSKAGLCWATIAEKNGNAYILVTLGAPLDNLYRPTMYQKMDALKIYQKIPEKAMPAGK